MNTELDSMSAATLAAAVRGGEVSAVEVTQAYLTKIEQLNGSINAFTAITADRALAEAQAVDQCLASKDDPGPLAGVPFSVKNLFDIAGEVTLAGSLINVGNAPSQTDATSVARMSAAGAICVGATNMGEYAYDFTTTNHHYGPTHNPLDYDRSAGGSSGGSAASVSAGMCKLSLGTDTNGSMRVPASFCGIWSLKPGYGRLSRAGSFPFVSSLDTIGVFASSVSDLALSLDVMSGPDDRDPVCQIGEPAPTLPHIKTGISAIRSARLGGYFELATDDSVIEAVEAVAHALAITSTIELPNPELARSAAYLITASEGGILHRNRLRTRADDFDPATRTRFLAGSLTPSAWYLQAQRYRAIWKRQMARLLETVDVLIAPATPMSAPLLDATSFVFNGEELPLRPNIGLFTQPITLIGLPVLTVPVQISGRMPAGVQLITRPNNESQLLQVAYHLEQQGVCVPTQMPLADVVPAEKLVS